MNFKHHIDTPDTTTSPDEMSPEQLAIAALYSFKYFNELVIHHSINEYDCEFKAIFWETLYREEHAKQIARKNFDGAIKTLWLTVYWGVVEFFSTLRK